MKKYMNLLGMMAVALMAASCSNDISDVQVPEQIAKDGTIHFTATLAPKTFDATTRALTESGGTLLSKWEVGEKVRVDYQTSSGVMWETAEVTSVDNETGAATIEATFSNAKDGGTANFFYPAELSNKTNPIAEQNGKLSNKLDIRKGKGTIKIIDGEAALASSLKLDAQYAIMSLNLQDVNSKNNNLYIYKLTIFNGNDKLVTVAPENEWPSYVYVALPALDEAKISFWAIEGAGGSALPEPPYNTYLARGTASLQVGKYYSTDIGFATIGTVIGADGLYYEDAQMAEKSGTKAEAVIAWMPNGGIDTNAQVYAVALKDTENKMNWENAKAGAETWSANHKVPGAQGEWALPSASGWMLLFNGGFETLPDASGAEFVEYPFGTFRNLLYNAGGDVQEGFYWTSDKVEGDSANRWAYYFKQPGVVGSGFQNYAGMSANYVRYVLGY